MSELSLHKIGCRPHADCAAIESLPVAYVELDADGVVTYMNPLARALQNLSVSDVVGQHVWELMPPNEREMSRRAFEEAMGREEDPPVIRRSVYSVRGEYRTYEIHRSLLRNGAGKPCGMCTVSFDVTEAAEAHEEAHRSQMWLESVLESVSEAVIVTDPLGLVRYVNPAAEKLSGWGSSELMGRGVEKGIPLLEYRSDDGGGLTFKLALDRQSKGVGVVLSKQRQQIRVEISTSPVVDKANGYVIGVVSIVRRIEALTPVG